MSHLRWKDSPELLIQQFARSNSLRKTAFKSVVELGGAAVQPLIEAIRASPHQRTIVLSIDALGQIGDRRAIPVLKEYVAHPNKNIRFGAIRALKVSIKNAVPE